MLNGKHNLWRAYAFNAETKVYLARGPIKEGATRALKALKALLTPPQKRSARTTKKTTKRKAVE